MVKKSSQKKQTQKKSFDETLKKLSHKDLENLKESVLSEIEELDVKTSQPRKRRDWGDFLFKIAAGAIVLFLIFLFFIGEKSSSGPEQTIEEISHAIQNHDLDTFEKHVDIEALAMQTVRKIHSPPELDDENIAAEEREEAQKLLRQRFSSFIEPSLSAALAEEIRFYVKTGQLGLDEQKDYGSLLVWLKDELFGDEEIILDGPVEVEKSDDFALVSFLIDRKDLELQVPLTFRLEKKEQEWVLEDIENLSFVLTTVEKARIAKQEAERAKLEQELLQGFTLVNLEKSAGLGDYGDGKGVLITLELQNLRAVDLEKFMAEIVFMSSLGQELKRFTLSDEDGIPAGETVEKTWTLVVDPEFPSEHKIYTLPQEKMIIELLPLHLVFSDGQVYQRLRK